MANAAVPEPFFNVWPIGGALGSAFTLTFEEYVVLTFPPTSMRVNTAGS